MADVESTSHIKNPDDYLNVRNIAAGGDGLIVNEAGDDTNTASVSASHDQSAQLPKAGDRVAPPILSSPDPVDHASRQRNPPRLAQNEVTPLEALDTDETYIDCPWCKKRCKTTVRRQAGATTADYAMRLLCVTGIGYFIPYLFNCCQDIVHYCSECGNPVAIQQYVYYEGAEGQQTTVFRPRPRRVATQYPVPPPTVALPDSVRIRPPQELDVRQRQETEGRQLQEMEGRQLQEMEAGQNRRSSM